jgi:putative FmdB family regulatory protein
MPLYECTCRKCSHTFEEYVPAAGTAEVRCPGCQGAELDRLIGLPARGRVVDSRSETNCRGDGPPCGAPWCGRQD